MEPVKQCRTRCLHVPPTLAAGSLQHAAMLRTMINQLVRSSLTSSPVSARPSLIVLPNVLLMNLSRHAVTRRIQMRNVTRIPSQPLAVTRTAPAGPSSAFDREMAPKKTAATKAPAGVQKKNAAAKAASSKATPVAAPTDGALTIERWCGRPPAMRKIAGPACTACRLATSG